MPRIWPILSLCQLVRCSLALSLDGGIGVGRVTKPGLPVPVGEAAINPVPRKMILTTVQQTLEEFKINRGVKVVISVPAGEEIAKKTLNGRLGLWEAFPFWEHGARRPFFQFGLYGKYRPGYQRRQSEWVVSILS